MTLLALWLTCCGDESPPPIPAPGGREKCSWNNEELGCYWLEQNFLKGAGPGGGVAL